MQRENIFTVLDETRHDYTWDYTNKEAAVALYDVGDEYFAMVSERREIADETGTAQDYRDQTYYIWSLYSKHSLGPVYKPTERFGIEKSTHCKDREGYITLEVEDLIHEVKKKPYGSAIREVESIELTAGKIHIFDGNLVIDRV